MMTYLFENDFQKLLREAVAAMHCTKSAKVLNIACERELVPKFLPAAIPSKNVFGVEINRAIVAEIPNVKYCDVDRDAFPFPDATFDLIISAWGIEHFKTQNVFVESARTLKPGGRFIFITPNRQSPIFLASRLLGGRFAQWYYRVIMRSRYTPHQAYYRFNTVGAVRRVARATGFTLRECIVFGPSIVLYYFSFSRLLQRLVTFIDYCMTNRLLYRLKPYLIVVLEKPC